MAQGTSLEQLAELATCLGQNPESEPAESGQEQRIDWSDLDTALLYLNKTHAVVNIRGKTAILNEDWDPIHSRHQTTYSTIPDFKNRYSNRTILLGELPKTVKIAKYWIGWEGRRQYEGVVFDPSRNHEAYYNLFRGLAVNPRPGDWSRFKNFIYEVIADGNEEIGNYATYWLADAYQNPGGPRPGTAIALRGGQGIGKGTFSKFAGKPFGQHFITLAHSDGLVGRFNSHLQNSIIVFADEAVWGGDKQAEGKLKSLITEPTIFIEPKGINGFEVKNCVHLILASNSDWVVPAGMDERRFVVLDVSNKRAGDHEYFAAIHEQMEQGGLEAMVYDLLRLDLSQINLRKIPRTNALLDQIAASMSHFAKFWFERLRSGVIFENGGDIIDGMFFPTCHRYQADWPEKVLTFDFFSEFIAYCKLMNFCFRPSERAVGKELKMFCPECSRRRSSEPGRKYAYFLPSLERCRELFEKRVQMKIKWDEF